jgi:hypothetical protein
MENQKRILACAKSVAVIASALFVVLVLSTNLFSGNVGAADPKVVDGNVRDSGGNPLQGATVTVNMRDPGTNVIRGSVTTSTDSDGFYTTTFGSFVGQDWLVGDKLEVVVVKDAQSYTDDDQNADLEPRQTVDVTWPYAIPEFGSLLGLAVVGVAVGFVALVFVGRKKKQSDSQT